MSNCTLTSLEPIERCGWTFKVSANEYDGSVLVFALYHPIGYARVKHFCTDIDAREWIDSLVSYTKEIYLDIDEKEIKFSVKKN